MSAFGNFDRLHTNSYSRDQDQLYGFGDDDFVYVDAEIEAANSCEKVVVR